MYKDEKSAMAADLKRLYKGRMSLLECFPTWKVLPSWQQKYDALHWIYLHYQKLVKDFDGFKEVYLSVFNKDLLEIEKHENEINTEMAV